MIWQPTHRVSDLYADHLVFKGGTSLSKAYGVIWRFSENVELTYDIRAIASDDGLFLDDAEPIEGLIGRCQAIPQ